MIASEKTTMNGSHKNMRRKVAAASDASRARLKSTATSSYGFFLNPGNIISSTCNFCPHFHLRTKQERKMKKKMKEQRSLPSPHQSLQIPTTLHDQRHERILRMLKHSVLAKLASTTNSPVSGSTTITQLDEIIQKVFPQSFHTPTHPTYASVSLRASLFPFFFFFQVSSVLLFQFSCFFYGFIKSEYGM